MKKIMMSLYAFILLTGCNLKKKSADEALLKKADSLAHTFIITDGHIDFPYRLAEEKIGAEPRAVAFAQEDKENDFDYTRCKQGGLDAPFMSIYIPSSYQIKPDYGKALADSLIDRVQYIIKNLPDKFAAAGSPANVEANTQKGLLSLPMGMENGCPIGTDLKNVAYFFERGIRYITLTHGKDNQFCDSSYDTLHTHGGLSNLGKQLVAEMNRVGIMIDIAHVDDSTFYQVMRLSSVPCIASHSSCRHFTPHFERNMSDDMIKVLAQKGGVIQINFGSGFLDSLSRQQSEKDKNELKKILAEKKWKETDEVAKPFVEKFWKEHPYRCSTVARVAEHIDHVVKLVGIDHVGFGSDFDGVGKSLPDGLKDVSMYPNLIAELLKKGYSDSDIEKICYKNVWRVWNAVLANRDAAKKG